MRKIAKIIPMIAETNRKNARGVSTVEYTFLVILIVLVLLAMSGYITRAFNGRWKQSADSFGYGLQYEPGQTVISGSL